MQSSNDKTQPKLLFNIIRGLNDSKEIKNSEVARAEKVLKDDTTAQSRIKEDQNRKSRNRKTPARAWTDEEEARYLKALEMFGRNVSKIALYVGTRDKV